MKKHRNGSGMLARHLLLVAGLHDAVADLVGVGVPWSILDSGRDDVHAGMHRSGDVRRARRRRMGMAVVVVQAPRVPSLLKGANSTSLRYLPGSGLGSPPIT